MACLAFPLGPAGRGGVACPRRGQHFKERLRLSRARPRPMGRVGMMLLSAAALLVGAIAPAAVPTPVLKWRKGYFSPAEFNKGMYTSPAVADLNGDGKEEVIWASYKIFCFDGATGNVLWSFNAGTDRANPSVYIGIRTYSSVVVADINNDGYQEIVTAHELGWLCAYDRNGYFLPGFPVQPAGRTDEITSLSVYDLDGNGALEIVVGWAYPYNLNCCVVRHDGTVVTGWPQYVPNENVNALGIFNANVAVGDLDGDGYGELVVPSDTGKTCAYERNGAPLPTNAVFGANNTWPKVVNYEDYAYEKSGWYPNAQFWMGTDHPATIADVDRDGKYEIVIVGEVFTNPPSQDFVALYSSPFIYNLDRTRYNRNGINWEGSLPRTGAPLSIDFNEIAVKRSNPVVVDLDGDGYKEILTSSSDGKLHCYWLDKTEHHNWPFAVTKAGEGIYRFSSEPTAADLDGDGKLEVIFTTWPEYYSNKGGELFILNWQGTVLQQVALPYGDLGGAVGELNSDGGFAAPTVDDVDGDGLAEILCGTLYAGLVVYDLPGSVIATAPWPTGRGDYARTGWAREIVWNGNQGDFSSDRKADILWHNQASGLLYVWTMNGVTQTGGSYVTPSSVPAEWRVSGLADFNADGSPDVLWHNQTSGLMYVWYMSGTSQIGGSYLSPTSVAPEWRISGVADFNSDGKPDILWHNQTSGLLYIWYMNGTSLTGGSYVRPSSVPPEWRIGGVVDFNGDGRPDILWHNQTTGLLYAWYMNGVSQSGGSYVTPTSVPATWRIGGVVDVSGDGKPDILWHNQSNGLLYVWTMNGLAQTGGSYVSPSSVPPEWRIGGQG